MNTRQLVLSATLLSAAAHEGCASSSESRHQAVESTQRKIVDCSRLWDEFTNSPGARPQESRNEPKDDPDAFAKWTMARETCNGMWGSEQDATVRDHLLAVEERAQSRCSVAVERAKSPLREKTEASSAAVALSRREEAAEAWSEATRRCRKTSILVPSASFLADIGAQTKQAEEALTNLRKDQCAASLEQLRAMSVKTGSSTISYGSPRDAFVTAKTTCDEEGAKKSLLELEPQIKQLEAAAQRTRQAKEAEAGRCGGGYFLQFVASIMFQGFDPSRSKGCVLLVQAAPLINRTRDGWIMVGGIQEETIGAFRSTDPLMNGTMIQDRRVVFLGMETFTKVNGTVASTPSFRLLPRD